MIITLYIYHGYEKDNVDQETIDNTLKYKNIAIVLFYASRFLSGFAAGSYLNLDIFDRAYQFYTSIYFRHVLCSINIISK